MFDLTTEELKATIFALRGDLETVNNYPENFPGEAEVIESALKKLEEQIRRTP